MPRQIIDTRSSRPRYVQRLVASLAVLALAVVVAVVLGLLVLGGPGK